MDLTDSLPTSQWRWAGLNRVKRSLTATTADTESSSIASDQTSERKQAEDEEEENEEDEDYFPASKLFEYQWPLGEEGAEHYMLQEHVALYLDIRGIQRKYPDLSRRTVELDERKYLMGRGVVTETQSNMGLVALSCEEVMELMAQDYSRKYQEYMDVVQEREFQAAFKRKVMETRRVASMAAEPHRQTSVLREAVKQATEYNSWLSEQRRSLRSAYFDPQTNILQVPRKEPKVEEEGGKNGSRRKRRCRYPVALLPGQYCDYVRRYTPEQLRRLPVNTVVETPASGSLTSDTPSVSVGTPADETATRDTPPPAGLGHSVRPNYPLSEVSTSSVTAGTPVPVRGRPPLQPRRMNTRFALCSVCFKGRTANQKGQPEELVQCSQCHNSTHPSCMGMAQQAAVVARSYDWQCLDCKTCQVCGAPDQEEKMVFCDECDRGYHSFCVGLANIPTGHWLCPKCGKCASCGGSHPGNEPNSKWKHEYSNGNFLQTLCTECSRYFRKGCYCPVCLKVYYNDDRDSPMVSCDSCDRWIHTECDNISASQYEDLSLDKSTYTCSLCRGAVTGRTTTN